MTDYESIDDLQAFHFVNKRPDHQTILEVILYS